ncbi:hypothetical protein GCM10020000_69690 [Streptomyces olivoverticillatus]
MEVEDAGRPAQWHVLREARHRQYAPLAEQGAELQGRRGEGDQIEGGERPLQDQTAQPVPGRREPLHGGIRTTRTAPDRAVTSKKRTKKVAEWIYG